MGREVRRVPADWQHPQQEDGEYQPLYGKSFAEAALYWKSQFLAWEQSKKDGTCPEPEYEFWEWDGDPPERSYYRPEWPDADRTHFQMYETTTEGTPISPVMATPEELARWLVDNNASAFAGQTATYEAWLYVCLGHSSFGGMIGPMGMMSGVQANCDLGGEGG